MLPAVLAVALAAPPTEADTLREQVRQLQALNAAYSAAIARLGGLQTLEAARKADDHRRLDELARRLKEDKPQAGVKAETAALAERLALAEPGSVRWEVLLSTGVLRDGLTVKEAQALVGPTTGGGRGYVEWYRNREGRHVAPYLRASVKDDRLVDWKTGKR